MVRGKIHCYIWFNLPETAKQDKQQIRNFCNHNGFHFISNNNIRILKMFVKMVCTLMKSIKKYFSKI